MGTPTCWRTRYVNKVAFPNMVTFMQSLAYIADLHDLEFLLDSGKIDFLVVVWILDDGGKCYSKKNSRNFLQESTGAAAPPSAAGDTGGARKT